MCFENHLAKEGGGEKRGRDTFFARHLEKKVLFASRPQYLFCFGPSSFCREREKEERERRVFLWRRRLDLGCVERGGTGRERKGGKVFTHRARAERFGKGALITNISTHAPGHFTHTHILVPTIWVMSPLCTVQYCGTNTEVYSTRFSHSCIGFKFGKVGHLSIRVCTTALPHGRVMIKKATQSSLTYGTAFLLFFYAASRGRSEREEEGAMKETGEGGESEKAPFSSFSSRFFDPQTSKDRQTERRRYISRKGGGAR